MGIVVSLHTTPTQDNIFRKTTTAPAISRHEGNGSVPPDCARGARFRHLTHNYEGGVMLAKSR